MAGGGHVALFLVTTTLFLQRKSMPLFLSIYLTDFPNKNLSKYSKRLFINKIVLYAHI